MEHIAALAPEHEFIPFETDGHSVTREQIAELKARLEEKRLEAAVSGERMARAQKNLEEALDRITKNWEKLYADDIRDAEIAGTNLELADSELRRALIEWSRQTGEKTFDEHLSVRVTEKLEYTPEAATEWAKANAPFILVADKKQFEQIAKNQELGFVAKIKNYVSVLAKDFTSKGQSFS